MTLTRKVEELKPHREQQRVYSDGPSKDLIESVREKGILTDIIITKDNVIVSGFCRWAAARINKMTEVPVTIFESEDELDIKEALVHFNKQRVKTKHQLACEAELLFEVEQDRAFRRKREAASKAGQASGASRRGETNEVKPVSPRSEDGKTRDKVGEALGVSGPTAEGLVKVSKAIKEATAAGDTEKAEKLKETLETKGVKPAVQLINPEPEPRPEKKKDEVEDLLAKFVEAGEIMAAFRTKLAEIADHKMMRFAGKLDDYRYPDKIIAELEESRPFAGPCGEETCEACLAGWVSEPAWKNLSPGARLKHLKLKRRA